MKYELDILESIIFHDIDPSNFDEEKFEYWATMAQTETERIKRKFVKTIFNIKKEKKIELYIQQHQNELIRLTDQLLKPIQNNESFSPDDIEEKSLANLYKIVYSCLEDLLSYIEKYYSKFFDLQAKIPDSYRIMAKRDIKEYLPAIQQYFKEKEVDKDLINIILKPLRSFTKNRHENSSFRYLIYLKTLLNDLIELTKTRTKSRELNLDIISSMVYLNYNSIEFYAYCSRAIKQHYKKEKTLTGQLEKLEWLSKNIKQLQVKPGYAYNPNIDHIKESLLLWIEDEGYFLRKKHQLTLDIPPVKSEEPLNSDFKIYTKLSVPQLAYLIRLFKEKGIIQNTNQHELLKFIAKIFSTRKAENISPHSLRIKYYNVDNSTELALKNMLEELQSTIKI